MCRRDFVRSESNSSRPSDAYMRQWNISSLVQIMACAWLAPSHYLNPCRNILHWILRNKLQWNLNSNLYIFIQENAFSYVVWKMAAILSRPQCLIIFRGLPYIATTPAGHSVAQYCGHKWLTCRQSSLGMGSIDMDCLNNFRLYLSLIYWTIKTFYDTRDCIGFTRMDALI